MTAHRWSGWPGAWCLDCGCEDPHEIALAEGNYKIVGDGQYPEDYYFEFPNLETTECPEPGSNRHNPYAANALRIVTTPSVNQGNQMAKSDQQVATNIETIFYDENGFIKVMGMPSPPVIGDTIMIDTKMYTVLKRSYDFDDPTALLVARITVGPYGGVG